MSFLTRVRQDLLAHANSLLDEREKADTIPIVKQKIRDLEDGIQKTSHEAAAAAASVTTLKRQQAELQHKIDQETAAAKAYLAKNNEAAARQCATNLHQHQAELSQLELQIQSATEQSKQMDAVVEKLNTMHDQKLSKLRTLQSQMGFTHGLQQSTRALKQANDLTTTDGSVDSFVNNAQAEADVAQEEFRRTVATIQPPTDPTTDAAVDDILDSLRGKSAVAS